MQTQDDRSKPAKNKKEPVPLSEQEHVTMQYRPRLIKSASIFFMLAIPLITICSVVAMATAHKHTHYNVIFWIGFFFCVASVLGWPIVMALYRLPEEKFACFGFMKYFLRLKEPYLVIASYSGKCPLCNKKLSLIFNFPGSLTKRDNYFAKCREKAEHTFPPQRLQLFVAQDK